MTHAGVDLIAQERKRQIVEEGFARADDLHREDILTSAALCYTRTAYDVMVVQDLKNNVIPIHPNSWPLDYDEFKPTGDPMKDLVKAGALIAAALDALILDRKDNLG